MILRSACLDKTISHFPILPRISQYSALCAQEDQVALQERGPLFSNPQAISGIPTAQVSNTHLTPNVVFFFSGTGHWKRQWTGQQKDWTSPPLEINSTGRAAKIKFPIRDVWSLFFYSLLLSTFFNMHGTSKRWKKKKRKKKRKGKPCVTHRSVRCNTNQQETCSIHAGDLNVGRLRAELDDGEARPWAADCSQRGHGAKRAQCKHAA